MRTVLSAGVRGVDSGAGRFLVTLGSVAALALAVTRSVASTLEVSAVVALLLGSAVAFGVFEPRARRRSTPGLAPDRRTAALAGHVLGSLDRVEHRRVELGEPWPQLSVGPTGVAVVDVCGLEGPLIVRPEGIARRDDRRSCVRCSRAIDAARGAQRRLLERGLDVPVRTIAVVAAGTEITTTDGAPSAVHVLTVDGLADVLARGPVLPMAVVDAAFVALTDTPAVAGQS